ncbi:prolyl 4-hydroxylase subunit alpha-1-like [Eriocheir sinensis]|uniref:prolyl 4-hydroxylase subunit alpha-1-like n=1 Tax=Eriocheir sinensis TaxID=95602 RepID=UPI0021CA4D00|nr:prolyl 4-hydroxylase subunit alpha-1-like [Eriocheir sinensis]XP_050728668.1 prolyl 4-hydroxylase subunit alpha-1-like [Eriocheir sinensis]
MMRCTSVLSAWAAGVWGCLWAWVSTGVDGQVPGQLYSSLARMEVLFDFDEHLGELLLQLPEHLPAANRYLETYTNLQRDSSLSREVRGHPLHVYLLLKRLVLFWHHISPALQTYTSLEGPCRNLNSECDHWAMRGNCLHYRIYMLQNCAPACGSCPLPGLKERAARMLKKAGEMVMPSEDDLRGAANSLARLQITYRIPIGSFMAGRIQDTPSSARLTVEDCVQVAAAAHHFKIYGNAWLWYDYCQAAAHTNPRLQEEIILRRDELEEEHDMKFVYGDVAFLPHRLNESKSQKPWDTEFSQLCRGAYPEDGKERRSLQCYFNNRGSPFLMLQPVRYEQLHHDPELYLFYDVISEAEIKIVKDIARHRLKRSTMIDQQTSIVTEERVSHTAWLKNGSHPALERIGRRVSYITQLHAFEDTAGIPSADDLQVLNYGLGGFYAAHNDVFFKDLPEEQWSNKVDKYPSGDRLATWMFYLNDVTAGGNTAFPLAGVAAPAVKGAAAFWFNVKKNGKFNTRSRHGGCPVLLGQKWVANRWIYEHANFLRRPCSKDSTE